MDEQQRRAVAADDGVQTHVTSVDEAALERVGEAGGEVRGAGDGTGACGDEIHDELLGMALRLVSPRLLAAPPVAPGESLVSVHPSVNGSRVAPEVSIQIERVSVYSRSTS